MDQGNPESENELDVLLTWLDRDRNSAAVKYEAIRRGLIRVFSSHGRNDADELADEAIERVTKKVHLLAETYEGDPALYFYGVANKMLLEVVREIRVSELRPDHRSKVGKDEIAERRDRCLSKCLSELPAEDSALMLAYFKGKSSKKIANRRRIARELGLSSTALRVKVFRLKRLLRKCVRRCLE